ncbi:NdvB protein, partial [Candidatus Bathyarchaeota archaeon]|nr:NdvB protein [Candidatus Bathyarchaeota archaeon]
SDIVWTAEFKGIRVDMKLGLPTEDVVELWTVTVTNTSDRPRKVSVYPYFTFGYMSWMNQSSEYRQDLGGLVGSCITPYQKVEDYWKNKYLKDRTYFLWETEPASWDAMHDTFEGEGGLHAPSGITEGEELGRNISNYETPIATAQYRLSLKEDEHTDLRFIFGPAFDHKEALDMRTKYLSKEAFDKSAKDYAEYISRGDGCLQIETPDTDLNNMVNHWLPRQVFYHGDVNRLTTDPQTRNYLQDNMGMAFIKPPVARHSIVLSLSQQEATGAMPDGIILVEGAELKYINQVPHTDHCVWLPMTLELYLAETADYAMLDERVRTENGDEFTVFERFGRAMDWLLKDRDEYGLNYIAQGDWCDPMNMVGYKGKGVSGWLTVATAYACNVWASICEQKGDAVAAARYRAGADEVNAAANKHLWDGDWYLRGITDDGVIFGTKTDVEGRMWLNPQAFSILSGAADADKKEKIMREVEAQLATPYGVQMFAPAFTAMREDIGRVTQKYSGSAENGSVYNHAAIFYIYSLYSVGETDRAYDLLRKMIPGPSDEDLVQRGQLPIYIPNYYRGAWQKYPRTAGRSSHLFNTGSAAWVYRCVVEGLCGLKGDAEGLVIQPQLPKEWEGIKVTRLFREATFVVDIRRAGDVKEVQVWNGDELLPGDRVVGIKPGATYDLKVLIPQ